MITEGVEEIEERSYIFTQSAAKELIEDLRRAIEEAKDHNFPCPVTVIMKKDDERTSMVLLIKQT